MADGSSAPKVKRIPCSHGLMGILAQQQYLPLFSIKSSPMVVEMQIVDSIAKILNLDRLSDVKITIENPHLLCTFVHLGDGILSELYEKSQGRFVVSGTDYALCASETKRLSSGTLTRVTADVNAWYVSVRSLITLITGSGRGTINYYPNASHSNGLTSPDFNTHETGTAIIGFQQRASIGNATGIAVNLKVKETKTDGIHVVQHAVTMMSHELYPIQ